jgi:hypothetical protein
LLERRDYDGGRVFHVETALLPVWRTAGARDFKSGETKMPDTGTVLPKTPRRIGIAADHGGFELKEYLAGMLREAHYEVRDFGDSQLKTGRRLPGFHCALGPGSCSRRSGSRHSHLR